jgi:hypothetical protein
MVDTAYQGSKQPAAAHHGAPQPALPCHLTKQTVHRCTSCFHHLLLRVPAWVRAAILLVGAASVACATNYDASRPMRLCISRLWGVLLPWTAVFTWDTTLTPPVLPVMCIDFPRAQPEQHWPGPQRHAGYHSLANVLLGTCGVVTAHSLLRLLRRAPAWANSINVAPNATSHVTYSR